MKDSNFPLQSFKQCSMKILLVEPFLGGSHRQWAEAYQQKSKHTIKLLGLKGRHWKWRMYGGAVSLAQQFMQLDFDPDLIVATDMLDLTTFLALTRRRSSHIPVVIYFHENQITYPWSPQDKDPALNRNNQYGFINYTSALAAEAVYFNSPFHQEAFLSALPDFLRQFPDHRELQNSELLRKKSQVLSLGLNLRQLDDTSNLPKPKEAVLLWNHRWEYDKDPTFFFETLFQLSEEDVPFKLIVLGRDYHKTPPIFEQAKARLAQHIIHFGYAQDRGEYARLLHLADILPVTNQQDFFGGSIVEAIYCGCYPILPNRLAYPAHIPELQRATHLYETPDELIQKLRIAIEEISTIRSDNFYRDFVAHYDWSILAPHYDEIFERHKEKPI